MKKKLVNLSYPMEEGMPLYGDTPKPKIIQTKSIGEGDSCNLFSINLCNHSGTHVDAPKHFVSEGKGISEFSIEELTFNNPVLLEIPKQQGEWIEKEDLEGKDLKDADCILFKTGFGRFRNEEVYTKNNPGIAPEAISFIRENFKKVRCLGIDSISITGFQDRTRGRIAHKRAFEIIDGLGEPLLLIEDLNIGALGDNLKIQKLVIVPWQIENIDSAPCTVLGEM
jgi:kynurenine formamidase